MSVIKSFCSAFLMYSRIPMPRPEWNEKNRRYSLCFFPMIGIVIGGLIMLWFKLCEILGLGGLLFSAVCTGIPVAVTGGIHIDGFCDVNDALASCSDREKSFEIMKDPHIGSFAVIRLCIYFLIQTALFSEVKEYPVIFVCALTFLQSRAWSGLAAVLFPNAKGNGSLYVFSKASHKKITITAELLWLAVSAALMIAAKPICGTAVVLISAITFFCYYVFSKKRFGGITGDLAGWFLQICELCSAAAAIMADIILY